MMNSVKEHKADAAQYDALYTMLQQYEESALEYFSKNNSNERVITH
jgi:hypothetical protein